MLHFTSVSWWDFPLLGGEVILAVSRPSSDWLRPPTLWGEICLTQNPLFKMLISFQNILTKTSRIMFDQIIEPSDPSKLTHKPGVVVYACNSTTPEVVRGGSRVHG
jgi:hypothetical protein